MFKNLPHLDHNFLNREVVLDFIRGISVSLMILSHALFFFYTGNNAFINSIARTGNILCFTIFLGVSGASLYYGYIAPSQITKSHTIKLLKRTLYVLLGYYLVAFISRADSLTSLVSVDFLKKAFNILFLQDVPSFTEFLLPFIFYTLIIIFLRPVIRKIASDLYLTLSLSSVLYICGYLLYSLNLPAPFLAIKALFFGDPNLLRFPILEYAPVFLLGIHFGYFLVHNQSKNKREKAAFIFSLFCILCTVAGTLLSLRYPLPLLDPIKRWPPSVSFLTLGITAMLLLFVVYSNYHTIKKTNLLWRGINYLGRDAFDLFITHLLLLFLYKYLVRHTTTNGFIALGMYLLLMVLCVILSSLNYKTSPSIFTIGPISFGGKRKYRPKKRHLAIASLCLGLIIVNLNYRIKATTIGETINPNDPEEGLTVIDTVTQTEIDSQIFQWNNLDYGWMRQIKIENTGLLPLFPENAVTVPFDISSLTREKKMNSEIFDIYLIYQDSNGIKTVPYAISNNTVNFRIQRKIYPAKTDNRYFLYYGNESPMLTGSKVDNPLINGYQIALSEEISAPFLTSLNRLWYVKHSPKNSIPDTILFTIATTDPKILQNTALEYHIEPANQKGSFTRISDTKSQAVISLENLPTGSYTIYADKTDTSFVKRISRRCKFYVSEPVVISWTLDYEGWDVPQNNLNAITAQTSRHNNIPLTHFFNPRIYLPAVVSSERSSAITAWIINRLKVYQEELGLHLHMHEDFLKAAGVTPKKEPKWGNYTDGYDVESTAYSTAEYSKLLTFAKNKFKEAKLPTPLGFRAGGWFADEHILEAVESNGFLYDSSGREKSMWSGKVTSPWDLTVTTQPYIPSKNDQNRTGTPSFSLVEIPNNGGDSWAYDGNQLTNRFFENFNGQPVNSLKAITYLSHPQWFLSPDSKDSDKMEIVLSTTDKFLYDNDTGPVFYTTLKEVYSLFQDGGNHAT